MQVSWSPYEDTIFASLLHDTVTLYEVENTAERLFNAQSIELSRRTFGSPLITTRTPFYVRCLDWCPTYEFGRLVAVGSANGRLAIVGFADSPGQRDSLRSLVNKEFGPRHPRNCNAISWNSVDSNLIAVGLDRHRSDSSLLVYDVFLSHDYYPAEKGREDGQFGSRTDGAMFEFGANEPCVSCSWFRQSSKILVAGFHGKGLRLFDLRDPTKPRGPSTKSFYGACVDPFGENRIASFGDNQLSLWDVRNFEKQIAHYDVQKPITQIEWSPTRYGLIAGTLRDTAEFKLFDVQHAHVSREDHEPVILERCFNVGSEEKTLTSFAWHPRHENRVLISTLSNTIHDVQVLERMTLNWSKTHHLLWACGRDMHYFTDTSAPDPIIQAINEDISVRMKKRAVNGYGMNIDTLADNAALLEGDAEVARIWSWLDSIRNVEGLDSLDGITFRGVKSILAGLPGKSRTEVKYEHWGNGSPPGRGGQEGVPVYTSNDRDHVQRLCGWSLNKDASVEVLCSQEQYDRAAAICVFHFDLQRAVEILQAAAKKSELTKSYNIIAVTLSGYTEEQTSLWRNFYTAITPEITSPYIQAVFQLLLSSRSEVTLKKVVSDVSLALEDRIGFACTFLNDNRLQEFVKDLTEDYTTKGNLEGLVLTGFGTEGIDLVQNFVDRTGDVQTASMISALVTTKEWMEDPRPYQWIDHYREVLDSWMFWEGRATFDVFNSRLKGGGPKVPRQIVATCNFCGKSINHTAGGQSSSARGEKMFVGKTPNVGEIPKVTVCSSCGKLLPRCALCQVNMGTPSNMNFVSGDMDEELVKTAKRINPLEMWFTWCQTCRHGGHASHLAEWFREHSECAVTGCTCKCMVIENGCAIVTNNRRRIATSN